MRPLGPHSKAPAKPQDERAPSSGTPGRLKSAAQVQGSLKPRINTNTNAKITLLLVFRKMLVVVNNNNIDTNANATVDVDIHTHTWPLGRVALPWFSEHGSHLVSSSYASSTYQDRQDRQEAINVVFIKVCFLVIRSRKALAFLRYLVYAIHTYLVITGNCHHMVIRGKHVEQGNRKRGWSKSSKHKPDAREKSSQALHETLKAGTSHGTRKSSESLAWRASAWPASKKRVSANLCRSRIHPVNPSTVLYDPCPPAAKCFGLSRFHA